MSHKGLTTDQVVKTAAELIEHGGRSGFSMRQLAAVLGVKAASLYNHVDSMDALLAEVCRYAMRLQMDAELAAINGKTGGDAVFALADAYRDFAKAHRELYWLIMDTAARDNRVLDDAAICFTLPLKKMMESFSLPEEDQVHYRRLFRAIVHGFLSQEDAGFFSHTPVSTDESFHFAVRRFADLLRAAGERAGQ